ncbi:hypothetical protein MOE86_19965 [Bacillus atrophaeus]|uniref:hypothetical protein n=1 Tax=Bacillus atrophaeus TaxID=1452 RepID=UPI00228220DE|nr:hypothetical protein [Bacillus atrophaeus]MCY9198907.1 hypothetical protein [Bacillus atrophaeus]
MGKGRPKQFEKMVPYNTRLQEESKLQADALVATSKKYEGQREERGLEELGKKSGSFYFV